MQAILDLMSLLLERSSALLRLPSLPAGDLARRGLSAHLRLRRYHAQITMLALPLTAVTVLNASPSQMGILMAAEIAPFVLLSLPAGVWLDRMRKLPVYVIGESVFALTLITVPIAAWTNVLTMNWLYVVGVVLGCVHVFGGTAAQIVLTHIVSRDRLVEAHSKNALAVSGSEIAGLGLAGALIQALGAPFAIAFDALLIAGSVLLLRGIAWRKQ